MTQQFWSQNYYTRAANIIGEYNSCWAQKIIINTYFNINIKKREKQEQKLKKHNS